MVPTPPEPPATKTASPGCTAPSSPPPHGRSATRAAKRPLARKWHWRLLHDESGMDAHELRVSVPAAVAEPRQIGHHLITGGEFRDAPAHRFDHACGIPAQNDGNRALVAASSRLEIGRVQGDQPSPVSSLPRVQAPFPANRRPRNSPHLRTLSIRPRTFSLLRYTIQAPPSRTNPCPVTFRLSSLARYTAM